MSSFFSKKNILLIIIVLLVGINIYLVQPIISLNYFSDNMMITTQEYEELNNKLLGKFFNAELEPIPCTTLNNKKNIQQLNIKLFNLITIKSYSVNFIDDFNVIASGSALGFSLLTDGVIIVGFNPIITEKGSINPFDNSGIEIGDRIKRINNKDITCLNDIDAILTNKDYKGEPLIIDIYRGEEEFSKQVIPAKDYLTNKYKLGLWIREDATGIGTLTYIREDNKRFGALGHGICEEGQSETLKITGGSIYNCDIIGINKGEKGKTGELRGLFVTGSNTQGSIDTNNKYGVFGVIKEDSELYNAKKYEVGGRLSVKPGKATILCCLNGKNIEEFEIEIIKTNYQKRSNDKSMVIRVVDNELIKRTGGIIQGMSGSPIIQNGKLIGAVTHVFISDPTKGFGIYLDWMIEN